MGTKVKTYTTTNNTGLTDITGTAIAGDGNTLIELDGDAIAEGADLGREALRTTEAVFSDAAFLADIQSSRLAGVAESALFTGQGTTLDALNFGRSALDLVERTQSSFVNAFEQQNQQTLNFSKDSSTRFSDQLTGFASSQSTNNDERLLTMGKWVAGAAVALMLGNAFLNRKKAA